MTESPTAQQRVVRGWDGRYFEDFQVGEIYRHPLGRTVLPVDNSWLSLLTQNTAPLHFDAYYASQTTWGKPLVDSTFTLALVTGQSVTDLSQHVKANLGWDRVRLPNPVFEGDTLYSQSEVLALNSSASHQDAGIVSVRTIGYNQSGVIVITFERTIMVFRRHRGPETATVEPVWDARSLKAAGVEMHAPANRGNVGQPDVGRRKESHS